MNVLFAIIGLLIAAAGFILFAQGYTLLPQNMGRNMYEKRLRKNKARKMFFLSVVLFFGGCAMMIYFGNQI